jgi:hypothetical protein
MPYIIDNITANTIDVKTEINLRGESLSPKYKVYTALLTQTGETAPVATVLENTLGFTPSFSYSSVGLYIINSPENYPMGKTACFISPSNSNFNGNVYLTQFSQSVFYINSLDTDNLDKDDMLANTTIEIRVYN